MYFFFFLLKDPLCCIREGRQTCNLQILYHFEIDDDFNSLLFLAMTPQTSLETPLVLNG